MSKQSSAWKWLLGIIAIVIVVALGIYLARRTPPTETATAPTAAPASTAPALEHHPISEARTGPAPASTTPLPPLHESDAAVSSDLDRLGGEGVDRVLTGKAVVPRIVATIDGLTGHKLGRNILPVHAPKGSFGTGTDDGRTVMAADNASRYQSYVTIAEHADTQAVVDWYVHHYPLFQQAYREQGYATGDFNDRLVAVINHLLATPVPDAPVALVPYKGVYAFADPSLESLSAGQKMLIRVGPDNEAKLKAKLRELRDALTGRTVVPASSAAMPATPATARSAG